jgi:hypothetical protein
MIMISLPPQHILIVVQQLVPRNRRNVHLCEYICSLLMLAIFVGHIK